MKHLISIFCVCIAIGATAQSESMITLREKFRGEPNVIYLSASGFVARTVMLMAGERDFKKSIHHIKNLKFVTVPKAAFEKANVSVNGFRNILQKDSFVEITTVRDHGDDVFVYLREGKKRNQNRYFILIDDDHEVIGIEIKGYIDPQELTRRSYSARR